MRGGVPAAQEYFTHFLEKHPIGEIIKEEVQAISSDTCVHSGMYNFEIDVDGRREIVNARFTFVWQCNADTGGTWKIIHHHSSVKPV